jgi:predicted porin
VDIIMKKTLIALSVLVASSAASANVELYNKDGAQLSLFGKVDVEFVKGLKKDTDPKIDVEDAEFGFTMSKVINDNVTAIAETKVENASGTTELNNTFVGVDTSIGKFTFGKQDTVYDGAGVGNDKEFGISSKIDDAGLNSRNLAMYSYDSDMFFAALSTIVDGVDDTDFVDGKVGARFGDFEARVFFLEAENKAAGATDNKEASVVSLQGQYVAGAFDVEVSYDMGDVENGAGTETDVTVISLGASYMVSDYTFSAGWSNRENDVKNGAKEDWNNYFVNAAYALTSGTSIYAEIGSSDRDGDDYKDTGYVLGMEVAF